MPRSFELTLTRWHHVAERLNAKVHEMQRQAIKTFSDTTVTTYQGPEQVSTLQSQSGRALEQVATVQRLLTVIGSLRAHVAAVNASLKISEDLAKLEALNRRIRLLRELSEVNNASKVALPFLETFFAKNTPPVSTSDRALERLTGRSPGTGVVMLSEADRQTFENELETLQAQAHALSDDINDRNRQKLSIELDDDVARWAGLS